MYVLPFSVACDILKMLPKLLKRKYQAEIVSKLAITLIRTHHNPIVASANLLAIVEEIKRLSIQQITSLRVSINFQITKQKINKKIAFLFPSIKLFQTFFFI